MLAALVVLAFVIVVLLIALVVLVNRGDINGSVGADVLQAEAEANKNHVLAVIEKLLQYKPVPAPVAPVAPVIPVAPVAPVIPVAPVAPAPAPTSPTAVR